MEQHPLSNDLVFSQKDGSPLNRMVETRAWKKALKVAGLPQDYVPHSARHTAATALAQLGMSDKVREGLWGIRSQFLTVCIRIRLSVIYSMPLPAWRSCFREVRFCRLVCNRVWEV